MSQVSLNAIGSVECKVKCGMVNIARKYKRKRSRYIYDLKQRSFSFQFLRLLHAPISVRPLLARRASWTRYGASSPV